MLSDRDSGHWLELTMRSGTRIKGFLKAQAVYDSDATLIGTNVDDAERYETWIRLSEVAAITRTCHRPGVHVHRWNADDERGGE